MNDRMKHLAKMMRVLPGASFRVLLMLLLSQERLTQAHLQSITAHSDKTVSKALHELLALNLAEHNRQGWAATDTARRLALPVGLSQEQPVAQEAAFGHRQPVPEESVPPAVDSPGRHIADAGNSNHASCHIAGPGTGELLVKCLSPELIQVLPGESVEPAVDSPGRNFSESVTVDTLGNQALPVYPQVLPDIRAGGSPSRSISDPGAVQVQDQQAWLASQGAVPGQESAESGKIQDFLNYSGLAIPTTTITTTTLNLININQLRILVVVAGEILIYSGFGKNQAQENQTLCQAQPAGSVRARAGPLQRPPVALPEPYAEAWLDSFRIVFEGRMPGSLYRDWRAVHLAIPGKVPPSTLHGPRNDQNAGPLGWLVEIQPGQPAVHIQVRDTDGDGLPDWELRQLLPEFTGQGYIRTHYAHSMCATPTRGDPGVSPAWPYIAATGAFEQKPGEFQPPIGVDWPTGSLDWHGGSAGRRPEGLPPSPGAGWYPGRHCSRGLPAQEEIIFYFAILKSSPEAATKFQDIIRKTRREQLGMALLASAGESQALLTLQLLLALPALAGLGACACSAGNGAEMGAALPGKRSLANLTLALLVSLGALVGLYAALRYAAATCASCRRS